MRTNVVSHSARFTSYEVADTKMRLIGSLIDIHVNENARERERENKMKRELYRFRLLTQSVESGNFVGAGFIAIDFDVIPDGVCGIEPDDTMGNESLLLDDRFEHRLGLGKEISRLLTCEW